MSPRMHGRVGDRFTNRTLPADGDPGAPRRVGSDVEDDPSGASDDAQLGVSGSVHDLAGHAYEPGSVVLMTVCRALLCLVLREGDCTLLSIR